MSHEKSLTFGNIFKRKAQLIPGIDVSMGSLDLSGVAVKTLAAPNEPSQWRLSAEVNVATEVALRRWRGPVERLQPRGWVDVCCW